MTTLTESRSEPIDCSDESDDGADFWATLQRREQKEQQASLGVAPGNGREAEPALKRPRSQETGARGHQRSTAGSPTPAEQASTTSAESPVAAPPVPRTPEAQESLGRGGWSPPCTDTPPVQRQATDPRPQPPRENSRTPSEACTEPATVTPAPPVPAPLPVSLSWLRETEGDRTDWDHPFPPRRGTADEPSDAETQARATTSAESPVAPQSRGESLPLAGASCIVESQNEDSMWRYTPFNNQPMLVRLEPAIDATRSDKVLTPGEVFAVSEERSDGLGCTFLRLADGRGWAFDRTPDGVMCTSEQAKTGCHPLKPASRHEVKSLAAKQATEVVKKVCRYLPLKIMGKQILFELNEQGDFLVDTQINLNTDKGVVPYRTQASVESISKEKAKHGEIVRGERMNPPLHEWLRVELEVMMPAVTTDKLPAVKMVSVPVPRRATPEKPPPLSPQQERVLELLLKEGRSIFFTGSAGTGKTRTLLELAHRARAEITGITAMTGIAASAMPRGATLHSWAGVGFARDSPETVLRTVKNSRASKNWKNMKLLIVDEASMMSKKMFDLLDYIGQAMRGNKSPFGGLQLAFCGDFFQLPPVSSGSVDDSRYCFESENWALAMSACIELTHVYRQKDVIFQQLLNQVRFNELRPEGKTLLESLNRPLQMKEGIKPTRLYSQNKAVDDINMKELAALPGEEYRIRAKDTQRQDGRNASEQLDKLTLFPAMLVLKVGAQVMLLRNQSGGQLVNGSRGVVESFAADNRPVVRWINGMTTSVSVEDSKHELGLMTLTRTQYPLKLCWAMTIHKAQGMSIDYLEVDLATVFEKGQAYVALSRARTLEGLRVIAFDPSRFWTDDRAVEFYRTKVSKVEEFMDKHLGTTTQAAGG